MGTDNASDNKLAISIYSDLASPAMKQIGLSAESLLKFVTLPFKFLGLTAEQLEKKYTTFIEDAINRVPGEKLTTPKSSIVSPLLDYAKFCFADEPGNDLLRDMFSKLLSSSINQECANQVHKSFVEVMRFLSWNEAKILQWCSDEIEKHLSDRVIGFVDFFDTGIITSFIVWDNGKKIIEVPATTPGIFPHLNFPVTESLDLLSSLGLIRLKQDSEPGCVFFRDLIDLKKKELVNFEIPTLFNNAILQAENTHIFKRKESEKEKYSERFLSFLLESEASQLYKMLSSCESISAEQLIDLSITRTTVSITEYGHQFLSCCT